MSKIRFNFAVNSEIRVVSSIISNTNIAVTSAFTITANNEELLVMNTVYNAVATETLEDIVAFGCVGVYKEFASS